MERVEFLVHGGVQKIVLEGCISQLWEGDAFAKDVRSVQLVVTGMLQTNALLFNVSCGCSRLTFRTLNDSTLFQVDA